MGANVNYKVTMKHVKTIVVSACNEEDAREIASCISFLDPRWESEEDWSAEPDCDIEIEHR